VLVPLWSYSNWRLDEPRADGAMFSLLVLLFAVLTLWKQRRFELIAGSKLFGGALLCGLIPLFILSGDPSGWAPALAGLADRAPLLSAWVFACALASWRSFDKAWLLQAVLVVAALASLYALPQAFGWIPPGWDEGTVRTSFPYAGIIHAVEVAVPLLLLALAALPTLPQAPRLWLLVVAPLAIHAGVIGSNAGRLGLIAGGLLLLRAVPLRRPATGIALVLVLVGELCRGLFGGGQNTGDVFPQGQTVRPSLYADSMVHAATTPLGIGLGRFQSDFPEWRSEETARLLSRDWTIREHRTPKTAHSEPLMGLLELGWAGSLLLLGGLWLLWKQRRLAPNDQVIFDTTPAWIALLMSAAVRSPFTDNPVALGLAALLLGLDIRAAVTHQGSRASTTPIAAWRAAMPAVAVLALALVTVRPAWAQLRGEQLVAQAAQDEGHFADHMIAATEARPWDTQAWVLLGSYYYAQSQWDWARDCFYEALWYDPTNLPALTALMRVEMKAPDGTEANLVALMARAEQFAPKHLSVVEARVAWLTAHQERFQVEAARRVQSGSRDAGLWWAASFLAEAQIAAAEGRRDDASKALFRASVWAPSHKALVERTARKEEIDQQTIGKLTREIFPTWPRL
jgi:tetratricopeptide (TPR) repeat protein